MSEDNYLEAKVYEIFYSWDCPDCGNINQREGYPRDGFSEQCDECQKTCVLIIEE